MSHEHDPHLIFPIRERQVDLLRPATSREPEYPGLRQEVLRPRQGIVVVILAFGVYLRLGPSEDPELVAGSEVDYGDCDGARPGFPVGGGGEEEVANEVVRGRAGRRVNAEPVEFRRRVDAGPSDRDRVTRFGEGLRGNRDGDL
ncbi:hypothetical protein U1Q18_041860 [Sarracenia purpurea var. burkii]